MAKSLDKPLDKISICKTDTQKPLYQAVFEGTFKSKQEYFEQKAVSTTPPLSVPEIYNMSTHSARFCKTSEFLREICEIDARKHTKI